MYKLSFSNGDRVHIHGDSLLSVPWTETSSASVSSFRYSQSNCPATDTRFRDEIRSLFPSVARSVAVLGSGTATGMLLTMRLLCSVVCGCPIPAFLGSHKLRLEHGDQPSNRGLGRSWSLDACVSFHFCCDRVRMSHICLFLLKMQSCTCISTSTSCVLNKRHPFR